MQKKYRIAVIVLLSLLLLYFAIPLNLDRFHDHSTMVLDNEDIILRVFLNDQEQWCLPPLQDDVIPPKLETAVLTYEDRSFFHHPGINPWAIIRAFYLNVKYGKVVSGGSTITMQVVRLASQNSRTIPYKLLEIFQAIKLELKFSKKQILKMYLDHAPYGRNIVGIRAASLKYFGREPENLTWSEAATLAILPNAPGLISPGRQQQKLISKRNKLLGILLKRNIIDEATCNLSKMESVPDIVYPLPMLAHHLSRQAAKEASSSIIRTTLNKQIQYDTEIILTQQAEYLQSIGINNICALICRTETGEIAAYCGSQDFWDSKRNGQVDGVQAARSPGSTLKPFLYALCMDDGILLPETKLNDVPTYFGAFSPENAVKNYDGLVTAHEALVRSLNVPAVRLLYTYGLVEFYESLKAAGISTLFRRSDDYGLTLIIGGAEATLFDLTGLYLGLGNGGRFGKLHWNKADEFKNKTQIISPGACYLTLDIMQDVSRPGAEYYWHQYENQWSLAWKTGTSFGNRDAWAIGISPEWTIGVWVGNFTGEGNPALSGAASAGPILFDIFNSLPKDAAKNWFTPPLQLTRVSICKDSGFLATENCPHKTEVWAPENMKPLKFCPYHKKRFLNDAETFTVCSHCWEEGHYHEKSMLEYPPVVAKYLRKRGQIVPKILPHNPQCDRVRQDKTIEIIYPTRGSVIYIPKDMGGIKQKVMIKIANRQSRIFWYL
ncbi:MAG: penicillin-binding protein 1C, partial [Candidatus Cloacimonetes bacterium]|nr:penicillin-binding protein 1C [Candidatus Cloacimonadota bacterium]